MRKSNKKLSKKLLSMCVLLTMPVLGYAENNYDTLKKEIEQLRKDVEKGSNYTPNSLIHLSGYADVGYVKTDADGDDGSFNVGSFAPIFHYQYRDIVMLESELEIEIGDDGETETKLEYLTIDFFINDNMAFVAGKFLSPIGQFRQNIHPSWINKFASAPPGFGHDGAAPVSDLGFQLRGGINLNGMKANYAIYAGNGPELKAEIEADAADDSVIEAIELDGVNAEAFGADRDGEKVVGGRFGLLPIPSLEIGLSVLTGRATITSFEAGEFTGVEPTLNNETSRDYDVIGADISWQSKNTDVRYEYIKSEVGDLATSVADEGAEWETWYAQVAYKFLPGKYEFVIRYTEFDSPHASADIDQVGFGVNYLFTSSFIGKIGYESNDNPNAGFEADDKWLLQLAYGF